MFHLPIAVWPWNYWKQFFSALFCILHSSFEEAFFVLYNYLKIFFCKFEQESWRVFEDYHCMINQSYPTEHTQYICFCFVSALKQFFIVSAINSSSSFFFKGRNLAYLANWISTKVVFWGRPITVKEEKITLRWFSTSSNESISPCLFLNSEDIILVEPSIRNN